MRNAIPSAIYVMEMDGRIKVGRAAEERTMRRRGVRIFNLNIRISHDGLLSFRRFRLPVEYYGCSWMLIGFGLCITNHYKFE